MLCFDRIDLEVGMDAVAEAMYLFTNHYYGNPVRVALRDSADPASIYVGQAERRSDYGDYTVGYLLPAIYDDWRSFSADLIKVIQMGMTEAKENEIALECEEDEV